MDLENVDNKFKNEELKVKYNDNINEDVISVVGNFFAYLDEEENISNVNDEISID